ncbi:hypothetical protein F4808DRAFT_416451 [Astrocystis sublimbata]|nr:hypothetical protein F4808DRAFT_416451 [Astrocystis sublimbata]
MSWRRLSSLALGLALSASVATASHIEVTVGKDGNLEFVPANIKAEIGDTITYKFFAKNHAVAQSTFGDPCQLQDNGIFSGFTPNTSPNAAAATDFTIQINDTKPLWFYCPQQNGNHCQKGMVHAINAPETGNTFDAYKAKAMQAASPSTPAVGTLPVGGLRKLHIDVGFNGELMFNPNNVTELIRTVIEFSYNPANHSIVQSSFDKPCQPIEGRVEGGFIAPFVPTQQAPSGVTFELTVTNNDPVWFYCAQTKKSHCQAGMVGSINAAIEGDKTFQAFKDLAAKAGESKIGPDSPAIGALRVNGTFLASIGGVVLDTTALDPALGMEIPPPEMNYPPYIGGMAGGNQPANYQWGDKLSDEAAAILKALQYIDNFIVIILLKGYEKVNQGEWSDVYPGSITQTLGSLVAQALIHRRTYTDSLQHFGKDVAKPCEDLQMDAALKDVDTWMMTVLTGLQLSMGATLDAMTRISTSDPWTVPALATGLGSQARMSAVVNLMQNHVAAAAPREVLIPHALAQNYVASHWAKGGSCAPPAAAKDAAKTWPALVIKEKVMQQDTNRVKEVVIDVPKSAEGGLFVAWLGPWGGLKYTSVDGKSGKATVPDTLSGHVWAVLTNKADVKAADIDTVTVAGPEIMWVSQQWSTSDL